MEIANAKFRSRELNGSNQHLPAYRLSTEELPVFPQWSPLLNAPGLSSPAWFTIPFPIMTNQEQSRALRAAILSLQSGLVTILEFLDLLADQSTDPSKFKRHIEAIRASLQQLDELPPLTPENEEESETDT